MSFPAIDQIRGCRSLQELEHLWKNNTDQWSKLPMDQAKELIRVKDICKVGLLFQLEVDAVVQELNRIWDKTGCVMDDIPQERRDRALELDSLMTQRANAGVYEEARAALAKWKGCWTPKEEAKHNISTTPTNETTARTATNQYRQIRHSHEGLRTVRA